MLLPFILAIIPLAICAPASNGDNKPPGAIGDSNNPAFKLLTDETVKRGTKKVPHWTSCWNNDLYPSPKPNNYAQDLTDKCMAPYNRDDWEGDRCGDDQGNGHGKVLGWFKTNPFNKYQDPKACWSACNACIAMLANVGSTSGSCWDVYGAPGAPDVHGGSPDGLRASTACTMGYHIDTGEE